MAITIQIDSHQTEGSIQTWLDDILVSMRDMQLEELTPTGRTPQEKKRRRRARNGSRQRALVEAMSPVSPISSSIGSATNSRRSRIDRELEFGKFLILNTNFSAIMNNANVISELSQPSITIPSHRQSNRWSFHQHSLEGEWN